MKLRIETAALTYSLCVCSMEMDEANMPWRLLLRGRMSILPER